MYSEEEELRLAGLDQTHEVVYGSWLRKTTRCEIERQIQKTLEHSVADVKAKKKNRDASSDSEFDFNMAAEVAAAANRKRRTEKHTRKVTQRFGCHVCLRIVSASASEPERVCAVVEHWHGWANPMSGPDKWEEIYLECESCAEASAAKEQEKQLEFEREMRDIERWEEERVREARKRSAETNKLRADSQSKRLKRNGRNEDIEEFIAKLKKLKILQLSDLCSTNAVLKSGKKDQLIERIVGVHRYGSLSRCPICHHTLLELQYKGSSTRPRSVKCKYMKGMGRPCRFSRDLVKGSERVVLQQPLRDNTAGDLASVGIICA